MTAIVDPAGLAHLTAVIQRCRHDWDTPGIRHALETALARHRYSHVARIAISSALDPGANTPGVIPTRCDNGWTGGNTTEPATPTPPRVADMRCHQCNAWLIGGEPHNCHDRAHPDHARTMRDQAKAAAKTAARPKAKETT